jgi:RNA methyltransferase, TrmH family
MRDASGVFWIEGIRQFVQAFDAGFGFDVILHSKRLLKSSLAEMLVRRLVSRGVRRVSISPEQFRCICTTLRASGIGAIVRQRWTPFQQLDPHHGLCWLVVESLRSPGNLGTILRTAEATGVAGVIFLGTSCDVFNPTVVRASMGGIFHLQLSRTTPQHLREWAAQHRVRVAALSPRADQLWTDLPPNTPVAILLGEERQGVSPAAAALADLSLRLPMTGKADSLNVAVSAGVMMYELLRRKVASGATRENLIPPPPSPTPPLG